MIWCIIELVNSSIDDRVGAYSPITIESLKGAGIVTPKERFRPSIVVQIVEPKVSHKVYTLFASRLFVVHLHFPLCPMYS